MTTSRSLPWRLLASLCLLSCFSWLTLSAADAPKKTFDVPAGDAVATLKQAAQQGGVQIMFPAGAVQGVKTNAVKGELAPREALDRMLDGTGLTIVQDAKTGALSVRKEAALPNDLRVEPEAVATPEKSGKVEEGNLVLSTYVVTGTRIAGQLAETMTQSVLTLDRLDIARTGAQSLGDVFRYIPQVSSFTLGQTVNQPDNFITTGGFGSPVSTLPTFGDMNTGSAGRTTAALRGMARGGTLLLVDGRRAPKNNQANGGDGYDLNGIPLAAVERIEVLLDGASAIYGADALGGVINIIMRKNYRGSELHVAYENTFDKDAGVISSGLTQGIAAGKLSGLVTLSWEKSNAMALRDRDFTSSYDRRPYGGQDLRGVITGGAGRVANPGFFPPPLPGLSGAEVAVPAGSTGTNLTVADYAKAGPVPAKADLAQYQDYSSTYRRWSALVNLRYQHASWLELYGDLRVAENRNRFVAQPLQANLFLPAGYPGNPFGVFVTLDKYFYDVRPLRNAVNSTLAASLGARGRLAGEWYYDASINLARGRIRSAATAGLQINSARLNAAIAAGQTPNLFYDSTRVANPNAAGVLEALTTPTIDEEKTDTWTYTVQANGPLFSLPAGKVAAAFGGEMREDYTDFPLRALTDQYTALAANNRVHAGFAEISIPVFAPEQHLPLLNRVNLSASYRRESYDVGGNSSSPRAGLAWSPVPGLVLRANYGKGFKVPTLQQVNAPLSEAAYAFFFEPDPLRGNQPITTLVTSLNGGNPALRPEKSENTTAGLTWEVPVVKGLSVTASYFANKFTDQINVSALALSDYVNYFPELITRGPRLAGDPTAWAGPITRVDLRPINVAYSEVHGWDLGLRYDHTMPWGLAQVNFNATRYTRNVFAPVSGAGPVATVNTDSLPQQLSSSAFLTRGAWGSGVLVTYRGANRATPTVAFTGSAIRWDWQFSYDFAKTEWVGAHDGPWYARWLGGTQVRLTVFNVFNTRPPSTYMALPDNTTLDARLRRYGIDFTKRF